MNLTKIHHKVSLNHMTMDYLKDFNSYIYYFRTEAEGGGVSCDSIIICIYTTSKDSF